MARPRTDISPRILSAAALRFSQAGVEAASLRSIAKDAGTSVGMVYYYFPTKDDLFFAVVEDVYAKLLEDMAAALGTEGTLEQRIRAFYTRLGALSPEERRVLRLVAHEAVAGSARFLGLVERFKRGHVALVFQLVAEGLGAGAFRADVHPFVIVASIFALGTMPQVVLQVAGDHLPMAPKLSQEVLVSQLTKALFHGVNAPRASVSTSQKSE
jgi:AcrR family transcriptional regulator